MSPSRHVSRRQFLQTTGAIAGGIAAASLAGRSGFGAATADPSINITPDLGDPTVSSAPAQWAIGQLRAALAAKGIAIRPQADLTIRVMGQLLADMHMVPKPPEDFSLIPGTNAAGKTLIALGYEPLGLVYALTELADRVNHAATKDAAWTALALSAPIAESPANPHRGIFRMFTSENEDKA
jgi:hypothetical protein